MFPKYTVLAEWDTLAKYSHFGWCPQLHQTELRSGFKVEARIWFRLVLEGLVGRDKVSLGQCTEPPQK